MVWGSSSQECVRKPCKFCIMSTHYYRDNGWRKSDPVLCWKPAGAGYPQKCPSTRIFSNLDRNRIIFLLGPVSNIISSSVQDIPLLSVPSMAHPAPYSGLACGYHSGVVLLCFYMLWFSRFYLITNMSFLVEVLFHFQSINIECNFFSDPLLGARG